MIGDEKPRSEREHDLSKGGEFRGGAQVIDTAGMPDGYVPPSASISTPPLPVTADDAGDGQPSEGQ